MGDCIVGTFGACASCTGCHRSIAHCSKPQRKAYIGHAAQFAQCFTCRMLFDLLDSRGFAGRYDFAYLPVNFETLTCLSHAFVNMVSPVDAESLREQLDGFSDWATPSDSVCEVVWNDKHQGLAALVDRYRNSPVMHPDVPEECKPILLSGGRRIQFPPPTQRVKSPKISKKRA